MPYKLSARGLSDIGLVRQNNEDFWAQLPEEQFFVLADGMGGHQAGEIAAREAVSHLCTLFKKKFAASDKKLETSKQILSEIMQQVNKIVYEMGSTNEDLKGMGTTLCCVLLHTEGLLIGHIGDSRIYRFRQNQLSQLTRDHSLLRELMDLGQLNEKQAEDFLYKNIITKAIGTEPFVEPTIATDQALIGDLILMCTDGLTDMLNHEEIQTILRESSEMEVAKQLIKAAKQKGGHDNITVVTIKIQDKYDSPDLSGS